MKFTWLQNKPYT